jgi:hypothetical protein
LSDTFLISLTPDGVTLYLYPRSTNSLVYLRSRTRILLLHPNLPRISVPEQSSCLVRLLHHFPWPFQHRMGCLTDQSYELGPILNLFAQEKSTLLFLPQDKLNNLRNTFTFISNFLVLGMGVLIFKFMSDRIWEYRIISYVVAGIGLTASIFFITNVKEIPLSKACA